MGAAADVSPRGHADTLTAVIGCLGDRSEGQAHAPNRSLSERFAWIGHGFGVAHAPLRTACRGAIRQPQNEPSASHP